jgi:hypothetical protein
VRVATTASSASEASASSSGSAIPVRTSTRSPCSTSPASAGSTRSESMSAGPPSRIVPSRAPPAARLAMIASIASRCGSRSRASVRASKVGSTPRALRTNNGPNEVSSVWMCAVTVDCDRCSPAAARVSDCARVTARNVRSCSMLTFIGFPIERRRFNHLSDRPTVA